LSARQKLICSIAKAINRVAKPLMKVTKLCAGAMS